MNEAFNFHDTLYVLDKHWLWILAALAVGIWSGWRSSRNGDSKA